MKLLHEVLVILYLILILSVLNVTLFYFVSEGSVLSGEYSKQQAEEEPFLVQLEDEHVFAKFCNLDGKMSVKDCRFILRNQDEQTECGSINVIYRETLEQNECFGDIHPLNTTNCSEKDIASGDHEFSCSE